MNEQVVVEREEEGTSFVDLGDAAEETREHAPAQITIDSQFGWGWPTR